MTIICRCLNKCFGICRRNKRDPLLPITEPEGRADVVPKPPAGPIPPPPKASEIIRKSKPAGSSKPTRTTRRARVSQRGGIERPGQGSKLKLSQATRVKLDESMKPKPGQATKPKPGQATKPKPGQAPKPKPGQGQQAAGDSEGNISDEEYEYPPLPPSRESSHTGITPEMSDIDINEPRDIDDIDMPDAEPGDELFSYPFADIPTTPIPQGEQASERATSSRKRGHIEDIALEGQEWNQDTTSEDTPSPAKRACTGEENVGTLILVPAGPELPDPMLHPSPLPSEGPPSDSGSGFDLDEALDEALWPTPTEEELATYRRRGAQLVAWLEDPNEPGCNIAEATTTLNDMLNNFPEDIRFRVTLSYFRDVDEYVEGSELESLGIIPGVNRYRYTALASQVIDPEVVASYGVESMSNSYSHVIGPGIIFAPSIFRHDGMQWNEIARALYVRDHPITTLRHLMYDTIVNEETAPYIRRIAYPRNNLSFENAEHDPCLIIERGTREYEELLGTKLGKAAVILLISSLPRGTIRIARAAIWNNRSHVQLRFEFELIPGNPDDQLETAECD